MRIAYVVSAYKLPAQLERLLRRLRAPGTTFCVHVDRKTRAGVYAEMRARTADLDVVFLPRHVCHWGGFGHVRATLKGLDHLYRHEVPFDYVVLLTGQDYPLVSPAHVGRTLAEAGGRSFMTHWPLPHATWDDRGGLGRVEDWHLVTYRRAHVALPLRRHLPLGLAPFGGAPYWCLSRAAVDFVQGFVQENAAVVRFFEHVYIPDELFFQTILMNSPLRDTVEDENLRYIDWSREPAPAVLTRHDLDPAFASGKLFARKFDETVDPLVLDLIDGRVDGEPAP